MLLAESVHDNLRINIHLKTNNVPETERQRIPIKHHHCSLELGI